MQQPGISQAAANFRVSRQEDSWKHLPEDDLRVIQEDILESQQVATASSQAVAKDLDKSPYHRAPAPQGPSQAGALRGRPHYREQEWPLAGGRSAAACVHSRESTSAGSCQGKCRAGVSGQQSPMQPLRRRRRFRAVPEHCLDVQYRVREPGARTPLCAQASILYSRQN